MREHHIPRNESRASEQEARPTGCTASIDAWCPREPHDLDADDGGGRDWDRELGGATDGCTVYSDADPGL